MPYSGKQLLHRRSRTRPDWVHALDQVPWLYNVAYPLWIVCGIIAGVLLGVSEPLLPAGAQEGVTVVALFVSGAMAILVSRPLAYSRDSAPFILRVIEEGWMGFIDYGPWVFRLTGSLTIGFAVGRLVWLASKSVGAAIGVGLVTAIGVWVWTWFAFPEIEEEQPGAPPDRVGIPGHFPR